MSAYFTLRTPFGAQRVRSPPVPAIRTTKNKSFLAP
jgi:hypothetical protein